MTDFDLRERRSILGINASDYFDAMKEAQGRFVITEESCLYDPTLRDKQYQGEQR